MKHIIPTDGEHTESPYCSCDPISNGNYIIHRSDDLVQNFVMVVASIVTAFGYTFVYLPSFKRWWSPDGCLFLNLDNFERDPENGVTMSFFLETPEQLEEYFYANGICNR